MVCRENKINNIVIHKTKTNLLVERLSNALFYGMGVNNMQIRDLLSNDQLKKLQSINKSSKPNEQLKPIRLKEKLTTSEWKDIMGMNRDTYTRRNGAVRRK